MRTSRSILFAACLWLAEAAAGGDSAKVDGMVFDQKSRRPVRGVVVSARVGQRKPATCRPDTRGWFTFDLPVGAAKARVTVSLSDPFGRFAEVEDKEMDVNTGGKPYFVGFALNRRANLIAEVGTRSARLRETLQGQVSGSGPEEKRAGLFRWYKRGLGLLVAYAEATRAHRMLVNWRKRKADFFDLLEDIGIRLARSKEPDERAAFDRRWSKEWRAIRGQLEELRRVSRSTQKEVERAKTLEAALPLLRKIQLNAADCYDAVAFTALRELEEKGPNKGAIVATAQKFLERLARADMTYRRMLRRELARFRR